MAARGARNTRGTDGAAPGARPASPPRLLGLTRREGAQMDQNQQEPPQTAAPERSVCSRRPRSPRNPQTWTPREGEGGIPPEGGFWVGIVRGVVEASLAWVVILRGSFVGILVRCARVGMFPVRMGKGSNYSRKSVVTYGSSFHLFPHTVDPCPPPLLHRQGCTWFPTSWVWGQIHAGNHPLKVQ